MRQNTQYLPHKPASKVLAPMRQTARQRVIEKRRIVGACVDLLTPQSTQVVNQRTGDLPFLYLVRSILGNRDGCVKSSRACAGQLRPQQRLAK